jgi:hypothetical protein
VAQHHRFAQPDRTEAAIVKVMPAGPADLAAAQHYPNLARSGSHDIDGFEPEIVRAMRQKRFCHCLCLLHCLQFEKYRLIALWDGIP